MSPRPTSIWLVIWPAVGSSEPTRYTVPTAGVAWRVR